MAKKNYINVAEMLQEVHAFDKKIMAAVTPQEVTEITSQDIEITMFGKTILTTFNSSDIYDAMYKLITRLEEIERGII